MKDRYDAALEQAEKAETSKEKTNSILSIVKTMATNHLPTMEGKIDCLISWKDRQKRRELVLLTVILLGILFSKEISLEAIWMLITKLF